MPNQFSFPRSSVQGKGGQRLRQNFEKPTDIAYHCYNLSGVDHEPSQRTILILVLKNGDRCRTRKECFQQPTRSSEILLQIECIRQILYGFLYSFWLRTVNPCEVNTPWMINVLRFAFLPFSGLKDEQGFIYSRITNSTTITELSTMTFT